MILIVIAIVFISSSLSLKFKRNSNYMAKSIMNNEVYSFTSSSSASASIRKRCLSSSKSKTVTYASKVGFAVDRYMSQTLFIMFIISAPLGMMLDNYHGLFNVLSYADNGLNIILESKEHIVYLKTALWVPVLFGFAGVVMSYIILKLDQFFSSSSDKLANAQSPPSWPQIFYGISYFSAQYYISGLLDYSLTTTDGPLAIHASLAVSTMIGILLFDRSAAGLLLAGLTALAGPVAEISIINVFHAYQYTHADWFGICSWIFWVYATGAPAVGNLARRIYISNNSVA